MVRPQNIAIFFSTRIRSITSLRISDPRFKIPNQSPRLRTHHLRRLLLEIHLSLLLVGVHFDLFSGPHLTVQNFDRQRVLDQSLDGALKWPRPELGVVPLPEQELPRPVRQVDFDLALAQEPPQM